MKTPRRRAPSLAFVLLPGLVLALIGGRAVLAELDAARRDAADRGRVAASRLARSVDRMVGEFVGALPPEGARLSERDALASIGHLLPRWMVDLQGRALEPGPAVTAPVSAAEAALVEDALQRAERQAAASGDEVAAAFLAATSEAVSGPAARVRLLIAAAEHASYARMGEDALELLRAAAEEAARAPAADPEMFPVQILMRVSVLFPATAPPPESVPTWIAHLYERVAIDPWGLPESDRKRLLDDVERILGDALPPELAALRRHWGAVRATALARAAGGALPAVVVSAADGSLVARLMREVRVDGDGGDVRAILGGQVPSATVETRLVREADALVRETEVLSVRLLDPGGEAAVHAGDTDPSPEDVLRETVPLSAPLAGWSAVAEVAPPSGLPPAGLLLAVAALTMTVALAVGAFALRRAAERHAQIAEERRTFLDHVAHEIRTPATSILALGEELRSGGVPADRRDTYEEHLVAEARRLAALLEDTLDVTRLDAARLVFRKEPGDLRDVVRAAVGAAVERTRSSADDVTCGLPDHEVRCAVDATALRRALANLVDNALRHGHGAAPARVTLDVDGGQAVVRVSDDGPGIPREHLPRVFERFHRVPSATHEAKGVGLGLALCREIVRQHGGDVTATSTEGRGAEFTATLPVLAETGDA